MNIIIGIINKNGRDKIDSNIRGPATIMVIMIVITRFAFWKLVLGVFNAEYIILMISITIAIKELAGISYGNNYWRYHRTDDIV